MRSGFAAWNEALAALIEAEATDGFPRRLQSALATLLDFDILMVFAYSGSERPTCLFHNMDPARASTVIEAYAAGPYLLDPFFAAAVDPSVTGLRRLKDMAPDQFHNSEYYRRHYVLTGIRDEVGLVCKPAGWSGLVVSFTRPVDRPAFGRADVTAVTGAVPVLRALAERHWRRSASLRTIAPVAGNDVATALDRMTSGILTPREAEVTWLILKGHSTRSISQQLLITEGTVKIHRKNIHQKLLVSSQSELFARFIAHLAAG